MNNIQSIRFSAIAIFLLGLQACSSGNPETVLPLDQDSGTDSAIPTDSAPDSFIGTDSSTDSGDDPLGGGCATASAAVQLRPLDLCFMLDQSGSMTGQKWDSVTAALNAFTAAQTATLDLEMSVQFFPLSGAGVCDYAAYAKPDIAMASISEVGPQLEASIKKRTPDGSTPTLPALQGAISVSVHRGRSIPFYAAHTPPHFQRKLDTVLSIGSSVRIMSARDTRLARRPD